jgi:hypothetical protein
MTAAQLQPLWTFNAVVDALGGTMAVARLTGQRSSSAICSWRNHRGLFPSKYYFEIKGALADRGFFAPVSLFSFYRSGRSTEPSSRQAA